MKTAQVLCLILLLGLGTLLYAEPLLVFYDSLYTAQSLEQVVSAYDRLLDDREATVNEITEATSVLASFNRDLFGAHINGRYGLEPGNFNLSAAWISIQTDRALANRAARKMIMLHRSKADAYKLLVLSYLHNIPNPTEPEWQQFNADLISDGAYFSRFAELAVEDVYVHYGLLLHSLARADQAAANASLDGILAQRRMISEELDIDILVADTGYRGAIQRFVQRAEEAFGDLSDLEPIFNTAVSLATYYVQNQMWQEMLDSFGTENAFRELGMVMIGVLRAYEALGMPEQSYQALSSKGVETAKDIIDWWKSAYPELGVEEYLTALLQRYPEDEVVQALLISRNPSAELKVQEAKNYIRRFPEENFGYTAMLEAYTEVFMGQELVLQSDEPMSLAFVEDLNVFQVFAQRDPEAASDAVLQSLETFYYGGKLQNIVRMLELLPQYLELEEIQYLMINSQFSLENYGAVIELLGYMYNRGTLTLEDLESLETQGNPICLQAGWSEFIQSVRDSVTAETGSDQ